MAGTALLSRPMFARIPVSKGSPKLNEVLSIQLYSIREAMSKDPMGSLTQIAKIGYKNVEHANYIDRKFYG